MVLTHVHRHYPFHRLWHLALPRMVAAPAHCVPVALPHGAGEPAAGRDVQRAGCEQAGGAGVRAWVDIGSRFVEVPAPAQDTVVGQDCACVFESCVKDQDGVRVGLWFMPYVLGDGCLTCLVPADTNRHAVEDIRVAS